MPAKWCVTRTGLFQGRRSRSIESVRNAPFPGCWFASRTLRVAVTAGSWQGYDQGRSVVSTSGGRLEEMACRVLNSQKRGPEPKQDTN